MEDFKRSLYEAVLVAYGKVLSKYDILTQPAILRDVGKEILDYLNLRGLGFNESCEVEDLARLTRLFVDNGFAESLEVEPAEKGSNYIWKNLYGVDAYKELHTLSDNPFLACPLNLCLYYIAERHQKSMLLHSKSFDVCHGVVQSQYEIINKSEGTDDSLQQLAVTSARLYELAEERERLYRHQASTDALTGVFNRRYFNEQGAAMINQLLRGGPLSLLMVDLDHFKRINDSYGHAVGDLVLKRVAALCQQTLREQDIAARLGGEEFGILLPATSPDGAARLAERLRGTIAAEQVELPNGERIQVTASIGVATIGDELQSMEALMAACDMALYEAKRGGRNRVCRNKSPVCDTEGTRLMDA
jgi:diguanylate cyclase (GGDEF)-like protein